MSWSPKLAEAETSEMSTSPFSFPLQIHLQSLGCFFSNSPQVHPVFSAHNLTSWSHGLLFEPSQKCPKGSQLSLLLHLSYGYKNNFWFWCRTGENSPLPTTLQQAHTALGVPWSFFNIACETLHALSFRVTALLMYIVLAFAPVATPTEPRGPQRPLPI